MFNDSNSKCFDKQNEKQDCKVKPKAGWRNQMTTLQHNQVHDNLGIIDMKLMVMSMADFNDVKANILKKEIFHKYYEMYFYCFIAVIMHVFCAIISFITWCRLFNAAAISMFKSLILVYLNPMEVRG